MTQFQQALLTDIQWVAIALVTITSAARISRLITEDKYPPSVWLRMKWDALTHDGPWSLLVHCGYCFGVWSAAFVVGWGVIWGWPAAWWIFNGTLAAAYLAAILQSNDGE